ncbi:MAG: PilN domain-containing protein [Myxococcota bacterium]
MIRINLLPVRQTQKRQSVQQQLLIGAGVIIGVLLINIVWTAAVSSAAEQRRQTVAQKTEELRQIDKIIGEVNAFIEKKKELEEKLKVIDDLKRGKTGPVKALDDLATEIPNRVWITELAEAGGSMTILGLAIDAEDVSMFLKAMEKSKYFGSVRLSYSKSSDQENARIFEFRITCSVNYSA